MNFYTAILCGAAALCYKTSRQQKPSPGDKFVRTIILAFCFTLVMPLMAAEQLILTCTSDGMDGTLQLKVMTNDYDEAVGLALYKKEEPNYRRQFELDELETGLLILEIDSHEVVRLHSQNFDKTRGGLVILDYLESGVNKSRGQVELEVLHDGLKWGVLHQREEVDEMFMEARKIIFGKVIGIKEVHMKISGI